MTGTDPQQVAGLGARWRAAEATAGRAGYAPDPGRGLVTVPAAGRPGVVLTAPHAVNHRRDGRTKKADAGTGTLAVLLAERAGCWALVALDGADPAWEASHPLKTALAGLDPAPSLLLDLHGMRDARDVDVELGRGIAPTAACLAAVERLGTCLRGQGLRVAVDEVFTAPRPTMLTNAARSLGMAAVQVEVSARARPPAGDPRLMTGLLAGLLDMLG